MSSFVLVHGVAHGAWCWERTVDALSARGHDVVAVDLPLTTLADDAAHVADVLAVGTARSSSSVTRTAAS